MGSGYLLYVLIGYLLSKNNIGLKIRVIIYCFALLGLLLHIIGTYAASLNAGEIIKTYKGYNNLPCILYSVGIFVLIKSISDRITSERFWKIVDFLGKFTFEVYLLQWFIMDLAKKLFGIDVYSMWYRLGAPALIYLICVLISMVLKKIPLVKKIVP